MAIVTTDNRYYSEIAAAIREKSKSSDSYTPAQMASAIRDIQGGEPMSIETVRAICPVMPELRVPTDFELNYTALAYIETSGTQYIDTGFKANQNTRLVMDAHMTKESIPSFFFGSRESNYTITYGMFVNATGVRSIYGNTNLLMTNSSIYQRVLIDKNKGVCSYGGVTVTNTASTFQATHNLYLFGSNENGTATMFAYIRLYSCQIYDNGTLVRDFAPCRRNSDGVAGLYDKANKRFYANAGSGSFTGA